MGGFRERIQIEQFAAIKNLINVMDLSFVISLREAELKS